MQNYLLYTCDILLFLVMPLLVLYIKRNWPLRKVILPLVVIPILWYFTYTPLHELSHAAGIYYKNTLEKNEIPLVEEWIQPGDWGVEGGYRGAQNLLKLSNRPTAIFAANDLMALGAIYAIQDAGFSVPDDIAIVGYDNREFTWIVRPNITTVTMPVYEMGRIAAEILLQ